MGRAIGLPLYHNVYSNITEIDPFLMGQIEIVVYLEEFLEFIFLQYSSYDSTSNNNTILRSLANVHGSLKRRGSSSSTNLRL